MPLSSSSVLHFTDTKCSLKGILEDNFRVYYCRESLTLGGCLMHFFVPMVSFCDIPLSEIKEHIRKYGNYGIGLTKEWAKRCGLNPVLYVETNSPLSASCRLAFEEYVLDGQQGRSGLSNSQMAITDVLRYIKNYEGPLCRKDKTENEYYRFSDEREWRYVPPYAEHACEMMLGAHAYTMNKNAHDATVQFLRLTFQPNDIKYIVIKDDTEITEFVRHLSAAKQKRYSRRDIEILTTRIITADQIANDV
jgi:hypothetical protein